MKISELPQNIKEIRYYACSNPRYAHKTEKGFFDPFMFDGMGSYLSDSDNVFKIKMGSTWVYPEKVTS